MPPLKTEKRKLPGFPLQSFAGWAGIPTSPPLSEALLPTLRLVKK